MGKIKASLASLGARLAFVIYAVFSYEIAMRVNFSQTENDYLANSFADLRFHAATKNQIINA